MKEHPVGAYLRQRVKALALFAVCAVIFLTVFFLSGLPLQAVGYASLLCLFVSGIFAVMDFRRFLTRHRELTALRGRVHAGLTALPPPHGVIESDYAELLRLWEEEKRRVMSESARTESAMMDYYTMWAHQIKTPITAMRVILQGGDNEENAELLAQLLTVEQYVDMVLSYLRLDSDTTDFVFARVPLDEAVRQSVRHFARLFIRKRITLTLGRVEGAVMTDRKWLCFVLEQLLSNALKYTPSGGTITIDTTAPGVLVIADTGIGIAPEDLPRVCDRGYTGYNGRGDNKSTGIGLYLCRRTLDKLGHTMTITSEVGCGTQVTLELNKTAVDAE